MEFTGTYSKFRTGLLGAAAAYAASNYLSGSRVSSAISRDRAFPTWKGPMAKVYRRPARKIAGRRMKRVPRVYRNLNRFNNDYTVVRRRCKLSSITGSSAIAGSVYGVLSLNLSDLPNMLDFTNTYQQYRIKSIRFEFRVTSDSGNPNGMNMVDSYVRNAGLIVATDKSKTTAPSIPADLYSYQSQRAIEVPSGKMPTHTVWRPCAMNTLQGVNVNPINSWILTSNSTIPHYGVQYMSYAISNATVIDVYATVEVEFKGRA